MILELFKYYLRPSSPLAAVLVFGAGAAWLCARPASRGARRYLLAAILGYWLAATPIGAGVLVAGLSYGFSSLQTREEARGADAVVVLTGGARTFTYGGAMVGALSVPTILRALEGARVSKLIGARLVVASGGAPRPDVQLTPESEMLRDALVQTGVPPDRIIQESASTTTRDQARLLRPILAANGVRRFVLVTSPTHMRRAIAVFRSEGFDPVPSVAPIRSAHVARPPLWLPNDESLSLFDEAVYGYAASVYYWWRGWTAHASRDAS